MSEEYGFDSVPLEPIRPGTMVLIAGETHAGARDLFFRMLAGQGEEGTTIMTTNQQAKRLLDDCKNAGMTPSSDYTAIIDCVSGEVPDLPAQVFPVSGASDLTGMMMRFSDVDLKFRSNSIDRTRTGFISLSTPLTFGDFRSVSRFVHAFANRIDRSDGLGLLHMNPSLHDDRVVGTISQFCSGRIEVREGEEGPELRARGLSGQPRAWTEFAPVS